MFSADIFSFVENMLTAATAFFYSTLSAWFILVSRPRAAPRLLLRRFVDPNVKQVGPLTLHFLSFAASCGLVLLSVGLYNENPIQYALDEDNRDLIIAMLACCLAGTVVIDLIARCAVGLGWPTYRFGQRVFASRREKIRVRRIIACYALVTPILTSNCVIILILSIFNFANWGTVSIVYRYAPVAIWIIVSIAVLTARLFGANFLSRVRVPGRGKLSTVFARELFFPITLGGCVVAMFVTVRVVIQDYWMFRPPNSLARVSSIKVIHSKCLDSNGVVKLAATLFNRSTQPAAVNLIIDSSKIRSSAEKASDSVDVGSYPIPANSVVNIEWSTTLSVHSDGDDHGQDCPVHIRNVGDEADLD